MTIPWVREIPDPDAEVARLAALRQQEPAADAWRVEVVERVRVTHVPTGKSAEAATRDEALGKLIGDLVQAGDIAINAGRGALGLKPFGGLG